MKHLLYILCLFVLSCGKIGDGSFSRKITGAGKIFTGELIKDGWEYEVAKAMGKYKKTNRI